MALWIEGRVVELHHWSDQLYSLRVEVDYPPFEAGQFTKIGLEIDGAIVGRPYSLVNAPDARPLDFYFIVVPGGPLTERLVQLKPGDKIMVGARPSGFLILKEVIEAEHLWLMATGTGIGPFLSILKTPTPWQRFKRVVLVHAVRTQAELSYSETIREIAAAHPDQFVFIPFVSREQTDFALAGRVPRALGDGRLEARAGIQISAQQSQIMLCGNPQMVEDTTAALVERGLKKHRRKDPGQISVENYW